MRLAEALALLHQTPPPGGEPLKVALVCGFTPLHLQTFLGARLRLAFPGRQVEIEGGLYDDFLGNLERLTKNPPAGIAIVMEWADLDARLGLRSLNGWRQADLGAIVDDVRTKLARIGELLQTTAAHAPLVIQLPTLGLPPLEAGFPT